jgi:hypothetical protein
MKDYRYNTNGLIKDLEKWIKNARQRPHDGINVNCDDEIIYLDVLVECHRRLSERYVEPVGG